MVDLLARVTQTGDFDNCLRPKPKECAGGERQQVESSRGDVLAHVASLNVEPLRTQFVMQFGVDEVDLAQVRLRRVDRNAGAMLHRDAGMCIALDPEPGEQSYLVGNGLAEPMLTVAADRDDNRPSRHCHGDIVSNGGRWRDAATGVAM